MPFLSKYGVARHIYIPIPKAGSANHAVGADWTPAAGDVKISKDGGAAANVTNLPSAIAMGNSAQWDFSLTATEMQAAQITVIVSDSATKAVDDTGFEIETYGNASAQHEFDLDTASTAQTADVAAVKTDTAAILVDTNELQTDWTNGGRLDLLLDATLTDTNELQTDWANGGRLDLILDARSSQASVDDLPTTAELSTALGSADDAVLAAIAALNNLSSAGAQAAAEAALAAYGASIFDASTDEVLANVKKVNNVVVTGDGQAGTEWGP